MMPKVNTEDFDNVDLSGNESDASYDMADDTLPRNSLITESCTDEASFEAPRIDKKGKGRVIKGGDWQQPIGPAEKAAWDKQAQMTSGDSDVESVTSVRSGLDDAEIDRDSEVQVIEEENEEEKDVEQFYDMFRDKMATEYRSRFLLEVNAVLHVLDSNLGEQPVGLVGVSKHARAIAAMFGDNVVQLRQVIHKLQNVYARVSSNLAQHETAVDDYRNKLQDEVQERQKLKTLHDQAKQTILNMDLRQQYEKVEQKRAMNDIKEAKTRLEQDIENYKGQIMTLQSKNREAEAEQIISKREIVVLRVCKAGLKREAERYESQIAAYKLSLQTAEIEQRREKFSKEELERKLEMEKAQSRALIKDYKVQAAMHEKAMRAEKQEKKALAAEVIQLDNIRQAQAQELERTDKGYREAIAAVKVEEQSKETAAADNRRLESQVNQLHHTIEEVKSEYSRLAEEERRARDVTRLENERLKKDIAFLKKRLDDKEHEHAVAEKHESDAKVASQRENTKLHHELGRSKACQETIRAELKEYQSALKEAIGDAKHERETEEEKHKGVVKKLEDKLEHSKLRIEGLHKFIKSVVNCDEKRVATIEKLNTELTDAHESLEKLKVCLRSPNSSPERQLISGLLNFKKESKARIETLTSQLAESEKKCKILQTSGEQYLRTLKRCSTLVDDRHALVTRVALHEDKVTSAETFRQRVHKTITSLLDEVDSNPESDRLIEVMERAREMENRGEEVTNSEALTAVEDYIRALSQKLEDLDDQYRNSLSDLLEAPMENDESYPISLFDQDPRQKRTATIAEKLISYENTIQTLTNKLFAQSLTHKTTLSTLQNLQQSNRQLMASHAAALTVLRERRDQISGFERLQQEWELKTAKMAAQLNQFKTEVKCLQDLHASDREEIENAQMQIRMLRRASALVEHVENLVTGSGPVAAGVEDAEEAEDVGYAGGAEGDGEDA